MSKVKRYVIEIANEYLSIESKEQNVLDAQRQITRIVSKCEQGVITSLEAVELMLKTWKEM